MWNWTIRSQLGGHEALPSRPNVISIIITVAVLLSVFVVQHWMTDQFGDVDTKSDITNPPN
jgi:hypothetical protein